MAIASFVTAYARMYLIELIFKAKRENVFYVDTDCLFVNEKGMCNLLDLFHNTELGKLKLEGLSQDTTIYRPKFYIFNDIEKCKGVKKKHNVISNTKNELIIEQEQFTRFKSALRKDELDTQSINMIVKHIDKKYDKGVVLKNGDVKPYVVMS